MAGAGTTGPIAYSRVVGLSHVIQSSGNPVRIKHAKIALS